MAERETGVVKNFNPGRGYGFIIRDANGQDIFVHKSNVEGGTLAINQKVEFEVGRGTKGPQAQNVTIIEDVA